MKNNSSNRTLRFFDQPVSTPVKWISLALLIKGTLFVFFSREFLHNISQANIVERFFITGGDTAGYYLPVEDAVTGSGYSSVCRMPGLLPIYFVLRLLFGISTTKLCIILLQFLCGSISVYLLARTAQMAMKNQRIFEPVFFIYAFSSFVSLWDHYGYADSFSVSFLIYSLYFIFRFKENGNLRLLFWSGFFLAWSLFFRPVHGIFFPLMAIIYLWRPGNIRATLQGFLLFGTAAILSIGAWTSWNYSKKNRLIVLQAPVDECYVSIPPEMSAIRELIVAWGGDIVTWNKNSAGMWFFDSRSLHNNQVLKESGEVTSVYNMDSIIRLRQAYHQFKTDTNALRRKTTSGYIIANSALYVETYKHEHFLKYYVLNKLKLVFSFMFPPRLDYLPFPEFQAMKWYHKVIKGGYLVAFWLVNLLGLLGLLISLRNRIWFGLLPLSIILLLAAFLGLIELRYFAPAYPLMVILAVYALDRAISLTSDWLKRGR